MGQNLLKHSFGVFCPDNAVVMFNRALGGVNMTHTILRLPDVKIRTGLSRSTIYLHISKGMFPESISLGDRAVGWLEADINEWLEQKITASKNGGVR